MQRAVKTDRDPPFAFGVRDSADPSLRSGFRLRTLTPTRKCGALGTPMLPLRSRRKSAQLATPGPYFILPQHTRQRFRRFHVHLHFAVAIRTLQDVSP